MQSAPIRAVALAPPLSAEQYAELRADLEAELHRLLPDGQKANDRSLRELAPRARRRAVQILDILRRMERETFGVCFSCRSVIGYERLSVIPETTLCAHCSWSREL